MKAIIFILLGFVPLLSCQKGDDCPVHFQIPIQIVPTQREYHVGDTLTFISKFHKKVLAYNLEDKEVGRFDMEGIYWKPISFIYRMDTMENPDQPRYAITGKYFHFIENPDFDFHLSQYSDGSSGLSGEHSYINDTFSLVFKLINKKSGVFFIQNASANISGSHTTQNFHGMCYRYGFDVWVEMNEGANNNIELMKHSPYPFWNTLAWKDSTEQFRQFGGYCFEVVE